MKLLTPFLALVGVILLASHKIHNNPTEAFAIAADPGQAMMGDLLGIGVMVLLVLMLVGKPRGGER